MRTGISRRWAACIGAAVVLGVAGLGVWSANADTTTPDTNTDAVWTVDSQTGNPGVDQKMDALQKSIDDAIWT